MPETIKLSLEELEQLSIVNIEKYAENLSILPAGCHVMAARMVRQNIRALVRALAKIDGNLNAYQFLEVQAIKLSATPCAAPVETSPPVFLRDLANAGPNVIRMSDFHRS